MGGLDARGGASFDETEPCPRMNLREAGLARDGARNLTHRGANGMAGPLHPRGSTMLTVLVPPAGAPDL
jgi:hypothetical protein